jgi:hypothetical protein
MSLEDLIDSIKKLERSVENLGQYQNAKITLQSQPGNIGQRQRLPLADRLSQNAEDAMTRMRLEKAEEQQEVSEDFASQEEEESADDAVVDMMIDDIIEKML